MKLRKITIVLLVLIGLAFIIMGSMMVGITPSH